MFGVKMMTEKIPRAFGLSGVVLAGTAFAAFTYMVALPYRLSGVQAQFLSVAIGTQAVCALLAILSGIVAVIIGARRLGLTAIILGVFALLLAVSTAHMHSTTRLIW